MLPNSFAAFLCRPPPAKRLATGAALVARHLVVQRSLGLLTAPARHFSAGPAPKQKTSKMKKKLRQCEAL